MADKPVVFVSTDWISDVLANAIEDNIDCEIIRGPAAQPPQAKVYDPADYEELFGRTDYIVASPMSVISREIMESAPRLKGILSPVIGVESIDVDAATELGIAVGHGATPENFIGMAEATVLFMVALSLDMHAKEQNLRDNAPRPRQLRARLMRGKTIGLVGIGRIGRAVVERLQGWEVNIQAYDPYINQDQAPAGVTMVDLDTVMRTSDIVSVHVTVTEETTHLLNEEQLRKMKPSAFLVNTARGAAIDEAALERVLRDKAIAGAGLDTFEAEPLPPDSGLRDLDDVILTPHMIGHTRDVMESLPVAAVANLKELIAGNLPKYPKNPQVESDWRARLQRMGD